MIFVRRLTLVTGFIVLSVACYCQDSTSRKSVNHYVGIQVNQLLRQLVNLGSTSVVTNPYAVVWSANNKVTRWGFAAGLGYTYNQVKTGDPISQTSSTINNFHLRMGPERKANIGKRWVTSLGGDIVVDSERNKTTATFQGTPSTTTETNTNRFGLGLRMTLNYAFAERMLLGTEGSYYLKFINETRKVSGQGALPSSNLKSFSPTLPAVVYLIFKF